MPVVPSTRWQRDARSNMFAKAIRLSGDPGPVPVSIIETGFVATAPEDKKVAQAIADPRLTRRLLQVATYISKSADDYRLHEFGTVWRFLV